MGEKTGFLSEREVAAIQTLHKKAPYSITGVSQSIFSVARHYGGMSFQGSSYIYLAEFDECVRSDVHKRVLQMRKKAEKADASAAATGQAKRQGSLDL